MGDAPAAVRRHGRPRHVPGPGRAGPARRRCRGDREAAVGWLEQALREHPGYLAERPRARRHPARAPTTPTPTPCSPGWRRSATTQLTWWLFLGTAFYERGHAEHAERLFRRALAQGRQHPATRVGLAEALLTQHRYADVEAERGELPIGTHAVPRASSARALAGGVARRRRGGRRPTPSRARDGCDPDELAFAARLRALTGRRRRAPPATPAPSRRSLRMLDALVRLEEFEAFERAVPLVDAADRRSRAGGGDCSASSTWPAASTAWPATSP